VGFRWVLLIYLERRCEHGACKGVHDRLRLSVQLLEDLIGPPPAPADDFD
jgi:hypothetical protein